MPRFVLLYHDCPPNYERPSHWDLMLEAGDTLRTWALPFLPRIWRAAHALTVTLHPSCPAISDKDTVTVELLGDHRLAYLEFEGALADNRGHVVRIASGTYGNDRQSATCWRVQLAGELACSITIERSKSDASIWMLTAEGL
jgi:hypothetical protein